MATGMINKTVIDAFVPEVWSKSVLLAASKRAIFDGIITHDFDGDIKEKGDVVHIPLFSSMTVGDMPTDATTDVTLTNYTETTKDITINKHKYVAFAVRDLAKIQATPELIHQYTQQAGRDLAITRDADIAALLVDSAITQGVGTMGSAAWGDITDAMILDAIQYLDEANAPEEDRYMVISPAQKNALLRIDKFVDASKIGDSSVIRKGLFGQIYGVNVYISNNLSTVASVASVASPATPHVHDYKGCGLFHKEAFASPIQKQITLTASFENLKQAYAVVGTVLYGTGVLRPTWAVRLKTAD